VQLQNRAHGAHSTGFEHTHPLAAGDVVHALHRCLPGFLRVNSWSLLFSNTVHGNSLATLLRKCDHKGASFLVVQDTHGRVFGGFASSSWTSEHVEAFYGTGQSFLFAARPRSAADGQPPVSELLTYRWTRECAQFIKCNETGAHGPGALAIGGGGAFGLWLDGSFARGTTGPCGTFGNPPLLTACQPQDTAASAGAPGAGECPSSPGPVRTIY
jgi:hypothetical protein